MTSEQVKAIVARELAEYGYEPPPPGTTIGVPWSKEKMYRYRDELRKHLVEPVAARIELRETPAHAAASSPAVADVWIVAEFGAYAIFFDPSNNDFGLAYRSQITQGYESIGVRGDLVGVYCSA